MSLICDAFNCCEWCQIWISSEVSLVPLFIFNVCSHVLNFFPPSCSFQVCLRETGDPFILRSQQDWPASARVFFPGWCRWRQPCVVIVHAPNWRICSWWPEECLHVSRWQPAQEGRTVWTGTESCKCKQQATTVCVRVCVCVCVCVCV